MAVTLVPVAPLLTLIGLFIFGVGMFVIYRTRNVRTTWKNPDMPHPYLYGGAPEMPAVPRPPWPVDEDGGDPAERR
ncbi:hypothetical protein [Mycobacteroides abscessus]|uniref:hypothetical protein n=1 Tax=Mycobacteroides abscessus TaxID=36809 RepID=UPI00266D035B|nr:hypothetical protein [Mycobacteroides abscessus]MDO2967944.1 hypothetical protein [Mycobacteroides abscessus subsp. bolletii]MDO3080167.1 hypothetical protein [Mycobacteroides abscessus subsp. bolletii]